MNNTAGLYEISDFKFNEPDIVTSWIGGLLEKGGPDSLGGSSQIIAYPVERMLAAQDSGVLIESGKNFYLEEVKNPSVRPLIKIDAEKEMSYFTFASGSSLYGLPVENINEVIKYKQPVNIFSKKTGLLGLISYRSKVVPVCNFSSVISSFMDVKAVFKYIIVCVYEGKIFGLAVNDIKRIMKVKNKQLIASSSFRFRDSAQAASNVFEDENGKFHSLVDVKSIYDYLRT